VGGAGRRRSFVKQRLSGFASSRRSSWYFLGDGLFDRCAFELVVSRAQVCVHDAQ
jgi:hypothetical protein